MRSFRLFILFLPVCFNTQSRRWHGLHHNLAPLPPTAPTAQAPPQQLQRYQIALSAYTQEHARWVDREAKLAAVRLIANGFYFYSALNRINLLFYSRMSGRICEVA